MCSSSDQSTTDATTNFLFSEEEACGEVPTPKTRTAVLSWEEEFQLHLTLSCGQYLGGTPPFPEARFPCLHPIVQGANDRIIGELNKEHLMICILSK